MLPKFEEKLSQIAKDLNLDYLLNYSVSESTEFKLDLIRERVVHIDLEGAHIQFFNKDKQKANLDINDLNPDLLESRIESVLRLMPLSQKKFSMPRLNNDKIIHKEHILPDFFELKDRVLQKIKEEVDKNKSRIEDMSINEFAFDRSTSKTVYKNSAGEYATEVFAQSDSYSVEVFVRNNENLDSGYISDNFYKYAEDQSSFIEEEMQKIPEMVMDLVSDPVPAKGEVLLLEDATSQLLGLLKGHLRNETVQQKMSLLIKDNEKKELSSKLNIFHTTKTDSPYDNTLNGYGELKQELDIIKGGKIENVFASLYDTQKYSTPSNGITSPSTLVVRGSDEIEDADYQIHLSYLQALHNVDSLTLDINLTGVGYIKDGDSYKFVKNIHFQANLVELMTNSVVKIGNINKRRGRWLLPKMVISMGDE
jgi:predicted Zn-dependent protease